MKLVVLFLFLFTAHAQVSSPNSCAKLYNKIEIFEKYPILKALEKEMKKIKEGKHEFDFSESPPIFKVGLLKREDTRLLVLLYRAVEEGAITKINSGEIIGPKVLSLINGFRARAKKNKLNLEIFGTMNQDTMNNSYYSKMKHPGGKVDPKLAAHYWSEQEVKDYEAALKNLRVSECRKNLDSKRLCHYRVIIKGDKYKIEYLKQQ